MFPIAIAVASVANGAGIGGATFLSPLFVIGLQLSPQVAIGTALITEVFGFASGVSAHARARAIDWKVAGMLMAASIPAAVAGSFAAGYVDDAVLKGILGVGLLVIAAAFVRHKADHASQDASIARGEGVTQPSVARKIVTSDGTTYEYEMCRRAEGRAFAGVGGLLVGLISTGLGELNSYALIKRCRVPSRVTVATSVAVVAVTALAASITHLVEFASAGGDALSTVASIVVFTVPGVIIGGQIGPQIARRVPEQRLVRSLGWLFLLIGVITLVEAFAG
jgi:hypothetical protein